ncbi:NfeD family protein [Streptomyces rubellomurinus]|uniref:Membrane protein n=2 Tax=Streptomyces TaxID=1883 RepID=A0A0F2TDJ4_STRR3|nr:NfeD family protein [Streptomyces rubellomurinus]KJS56664.1 membrane protein [Streptomyces rubellomurinus subsp. indigoferus]KJS60370.1 membrane protein [Streptomyces rubellomurinus]
MVGVDSWIWWLLAAAALGIPLVLTAVPEFALFALGAVAAAVVAGLGAGVVPQAVTFLVVSVGLVAFVGPIARRQLRTGPQIKMGIEALKGATAVVAETVDGEGGRIKLNGEIWSARALHPGQVYQPGQQVDVVEIQGATALVV